MDNIGKARVILEGDTSRLEKDIQDALNKSDFKLKGKALKSFRDSISAAARDATKEGVESGLKDVDISNFDSSLKALTNNLRQSVSDGVEGGFEDADTNAFAARTTDLAKNLQESIKKGAEDGFKSVDASSFSDAVKKASSETSDTVKEATEKGLKDVDTSVFSDNISNIASSTGDGVKKGTEDGFKDVDPSTATWFMNDAGPFITREFKDSIEAGFESVETQHLNEILRNAGDEAGKNIRESLNREFAEMGKETRSIDVDLIVDLDDAISRSLENFDDSDRHIEFEVGLDTTSKERTEHSLQNIIDSYDDSEIELKPNVSTVASRLASLRLKWTTRPRIVPIIPVVQKKALLNAAAQITAAFSGLRASNQILQNFWDSVKNIDKSITNYMKFGTAITYIGTLITTLVSDAGSLIVELGRIAGVLIPLPGIMAGFAFGIGATVAVFRDFGQVLPHVGEMFGDLQSQMSRTFWDSAREPIRDLIDTLFPELERGLIATSSSLATFFGNLSTSLKTALSDELAGMFDNLNESIIISSRYTDEFAGIIEVLGRHGSEYLPRLAEWFGEISTRFHNFLRDAESSGELQTWADNGIENLGHLGRAIWNVGRVFYEFGTIAEDAGGASLKSFADGLGAIADRLGSEPFRSRMVAVLREAHDALGLINRESGPAVSEFFENLGYLVQHAMSTMAPAISAALTGIAKAFSSNAFTAGYKNFIDGIASGVITVSGSFEPLGHAIGSIGTIVGNMVTEFAPLIAQVLGSLSVTIQALEEPIIAVTNFLSGLIQTVADMGPTFVIAGGMLLIFRGHIFTLLKSLGLSPIVAFKKGVAEVGAGAVQAGRLSTAAATGFRSIGVSAGFAMPLVRGLGLALRSALISTGIGAVIVGLSLAIGHFVGKSGEAKAAGDAYAETLDKITGAATEASEAHQLDWWLDSLDSSHIDRMDAMGVSISDMISAVNEGPEAVDALQSRLDRMRWTAIDPRDWNAVREYQEHLDELAGITETGNASFQRRRDEMGKLGLTTDENTGLTAELTDEQIANNAATERAAEVERLHALALEQAQEAVKTKITTLGELIAVQSRQGESLRSVEDSLSAFHAAMDGVTGPGSEGFVNALNEQRDGYDLTAEAGRSYRDELVSLVDAGNGYVESLANQGVSGQELASALDNVYESSVDAAMGHGMTREAAEAYVDELNGIPHEVRTDMILNTEDTLYDVGEFIAVVDSMTGTVSINGDPLTGEEVLGDFLEEIEDNPGYVDIEGNIAPADASVLSWIQMMRENDSAIMPLDVDVHAADATLTTWVQDTRTGQMVEVPVRADVAALDAILNEYRWSDEFNTYIRIGANPSEFEAEIAAAMDQAENPAEIPEIPISADAQAIVDAINGLREGEIPDIEVGTAADTGGMVADIEETVAPEVTALATIDKGVTSNTVARELEGLAPEIPFVADTSDVSNEHSLLMRTIEGTSPVMGLDVDGDPVMVTVTEIVEDAEGNLITLETEVELPTDGGLRDFRLDEEGNPIVVPSETDTSTVDEAMEAMRQRYSGGAGGGIGSFAMNVPVGMNDEMARNDFNALLLEINGSTPVLDIDGNAMPGSAAHIGLLGAINSSTGVLDIDGNDAPGAREHAGLLQNINSSSGTVDMLGEDAPAVKTLRDAVRYINAATGTIRVLGNDAGVRRATTNAVSSINRSKGTVTLNGNANPAFRAISSVVQAANRSVGTITIRTRRVEVPMADGGILPSVQAFANGGLRGAEQHIAQIARGGVTRVWAEPETGGEAYIPLALSKRKRSLEILEQVAAIMGHYLAPVSGRSLKKFADGGLLSGAQTIPRNTGSNGTINRSSIVTATPTTQVVNNITVNTTGNVDAQTLARDVSRIIMFKKI